MVRLSMSLLGPVQIALEGQSVTNWGYAKVAALLAYLTVEADHPHRRESLAGLLWPDRPDALARGSLRSALHRLRRAMDQPEGPHPYLVTTRETVQFDVHSDHWLDVTAFARRVPSARLPPPHSAGGDVGEAGPGTLCALEEAAHLYRGPFLQDLIVGDSAAFQDWSVAVRERLERSALDVFQTLGEHFGALGDYPRACAHAQRWVEVAPWDEQAHQQLMRWLALDGQRAAALAQFEICRRRLTDELGIAPAAETRELYCQIRDGTLVSPARRGTPYRLLPAHPSPRVPFEEPAGRPFVARERELGMLREHLALALGGNGRAVFVVGEAGQGKTALLQAFAAEAERRQSDLVVADGHCSAYTGIGDPYLPFREILALLSVTSRPGGRLAPSPASGRGACGAPCR